MWWRRDWFENASPASVLGECKTFGNFEVAQIRQTWLTVTRFPGSAVVFATLRHELTDDEKSVLTRLARRGRRLSKDGIWEHPLLVLTGWELCSNSGPPLCWNDKRQAIGPITDRFEHRGGIRYLANILQHLHLGMALEESGE